MVDRLSPEALTHAHEVDSLLRAGSRLSAVYGRHAPAAMPTDRTLTDWRVYGAALLARSHYLLESTQCLKKREPDAAVLARVLYEHVVAFSWLCIAPEENVRKLIYWEICERKKAINDMKSLGEDTSDAGIEAVTKLLGADFKAPDPGLPVLAEQADAHWGARIGGVWERGRGGLRALYPSVYRQFSMFTHPTVAGLHSFVTLHDDTARIGRPRPGRAHGVALAPFMFALGLLVASYSLGWPPAEDVERAFEDEENAQ
jgi:hypothetical protein